MARKQADHVLRGVFTLMLGMAACRLLFAPAFIASAGAPASTAPKSTIQSATATKQAHGTLAGASSLVERRVGRSNLAARKALQVDLTGKVAFVAGVADTYSYGFGIARELANAGATVVFGTWPPVLKIFERTLKKKGDDFKLDDGSEMEIGKVYPLDAVFDTPEDVPEEIKNNKRYACGSFTIQEVVDQVKADYGKVDILVHSLANGPEVTKPLLDTSRKGYLAASSASAYSMVSMVSRFAPLMPVGGSVVSLSYIAAERVVPGYGGGMSSAKAQLESDTRTLAFEAGRRYGIRVNTISAGPLKSRAASAIGGDGDKTFIERAIDYTRSNAPLSKVDCSPQNVGSAAFCLLTDLMSAVTGITLYVDSGLHAMGQTLDSPAFEGIAPPEFEGKEDKDLVPR